MKCLLLLVVTAFINVSLADKYTDRYDAFNIDEVLNNKRLLGSYMKCILSKGPCTPEGKELKEHLKDGMQTGCTKCTDAQKEKARTVVKHLQAHNQQYWEDIKKKFDPDNKYKEIYEGFLASDD